MNIFKNDNDLIKTCLFSFFKWNKTIKDKTKIYL